jgi:nitrate/nitrite transporter NarK
MSRETQPQLEPEADDNQDPPVPQLADVPPEEWDYSTGQAFAGCGVIGAVVMAIILPIILGIFIDSPWAQIIGFGIPGVLALVCVLIIAQMTRQKRAERRAEHSGDDAQM